MEEIRAFEVGMRIEVVEDRRRPAADGSGAAAGGGARDARPRPAAPLPRSNVDRAVHGGACGLRGRFPRISHGPRYYFIDRSAIQQPRGLPVLIRRSRGFFGFV